MVGGFSSTHRAQTPGPAPHIAPRTGLLDRAPARAKVPEIVVRVRRAGGRLVLSPVQCEQHVISAGTPPQLAHAISSCFAEVEIAAYARWKGQRPDIAGLPRGDSFDEPLNRGGAPVVSPVAALSSAGSRKRDSWGKGGARERHPGEYTPNPDGTWLAPSGRTIRDPEGCRRIVARRIAAGLTVVADEYVCDLSGQRDVLDELAARDGLTPDEVVAAALAAYAKPAPPPEPAPAPPVDLGQAREQKRTRKGVADGQLELPLGLTCKVPARHLAVVA